MKRIETQVDLPAVHRLDHRGPRDPQPLRDPCLRHALRSKPPDQRPVFQSDHSPIVECSLFTAETVQFSSAADTQRRVGVRVSWAWRMRQQARRRPARRWPAIAPGSAPPGAVPDPRVVVGEDLGVPAMAGQPRHEVVAGGEPLDAVGLVHRPLLPARPAEHPDPQVLQQERASRCGQGGHRLRELLDELGPAHARQRH